MTYTNGIPSVSDYSHWNEDAQRIWYEENKYDMEHPEVFEEEERRWFEDDSPIDPDECAREYGHSFNTYTRRGVMYCTDCDTRLGIVCKAIVYNEGWPRPCGELEKTEWLHYNNDDSRAIDHEYVPDYR